jgi:hypothetical protein
VLADRLRIPPLLVAVCGIVPLLPGSVIHRGLFSIVAEADIQGGFLPSSEPRRSGSPSPLRSCWASTSADRSVGTGSL